MMLEQVAKHDPALSAADIQKLKATIDLKYKNLINSYLGLNLTSAPTMANYKQIEALVLEETTFDNKIEKKELLDTDNLQTFLENKKSKQEWISLAEPKKGKSQFFLTDHGLYEVSNKKIIGLALFNQDELQDYLGNNKMLPALSLHLPTIAKKEGCLGIMSVFFKGLLK